MFGSWRVAGYRTLSSKCIAVSRHIIETTFSIVAFMAFLTLYFFSELDFRMYY